MILYKTNWKLYIKNNNLEKLILSKTGKELRGLAKINKMIKNYHQTKVKIKYNKNNNIDPRYLGTRALTKRLT